MNKFLQTREEIDQCTKMMEDNGLTCSGLSCKNWEAAQVIPYFRDGNWLDAGSDGGIILPNLLKKNVKGVKVGIDLAYQDSFSENGIDYIKGDLCDVPLPDGFFNYITCLSVIEHSVNFTKLVKECSRLLCKGGQLFVSFDYWEPAPDTIRIRLYSLDWIIVNKESLLVLVEIMKEHGLELTSEIDWTLKDAVINDTYCSPASGVAYTFSILHFIKQ